MTNFSNKKPKLFSNFLHFHSKLISLCLKPCVFSDLFSILHFYCRNMFLFLNHWRFWNFLHFYCRNFSKFVKVLQSFYISGILLPKLLTFSKSMKILWLFLMFALIGILSKINKKWNFLFFLHYHCKYISLFRKCWGFFVAEISSFF